MEAKLEARSLNLEAGGWTKVRRPAFFIFSTQYSVPGTRYQPLTTHCVMWYTFTVTLALNSNVGNFSFEME